MQGPGGLGRDGAGEGWAEEEEPMAAAALSLLAGAWLAGRVLLPGLTGRAGWVGTVMPCRLTVTMACGGAVAGRGLAEPASFRPAAAADADLRHHDDDDHSEPQQVIGRKRLAAEVAGDAFWTGVETGRAAVVRSRQGLVMSATCSAGGRPGTIREAG